MIELERVDLLFDVVEALKVTPARLSSTTMAG